jgi:hypothetical protein
LSNMGCTSGGGWRWRVGATIDRAILPDALRAAARGFLVFCLTLQRPHDSLDSALRHERASGSGIETSLNRFP